MLTTEIPKERQGATIAGRLFGAPVRKYERLKDELLAKADGVQYLLKEMESFNEFAADQACVDIKAFTTRCRHRGESLRDFIVDWENIRATAEDHDFQFGGGVDAFLMIDAAGMHLADITIMLGSLGGVMDYTKVRQYLLRVSPVEPTHTAWAVEMLQELSEMELEDVFAAFDVKPEEDEPRDDNDFEVNLADYEFDVPEGDESEFQEIYASFIKARRELSRFRPKRKYKYRPAANVRRFKHGVRKGGGMQGEGKGGKGG